MIHYANTNQKKVEVALLISDGADFRARKMIRNKEKDCIIIEGWVLQEAIIIFLYFLFFK